MTVHPLPAAELKGEGLTSQRVRDHLALYLQENGIDDQRVIETVRTVPRHHFIDPALHARAYENTALPIGHGQTISKPWVVARMTAALLEHFDRHGIAACSKVLEIGTGSGYQTVILATLVQQIYTIERIEALLRQARRRFRQLGLEHIRSRHDDGNLGWPGCAPFDAIIMTAASDNIPAALLEQLTPDGVLLAPIGPPSCQMLRRICRNKCGRIVQDDVLEAVHFVPLLEGLD